MAQNEEKRGNNGPTIPRVQAVKFIERSNGTVKGYAVNTFHGLVKGYNEDRVSIIMNITKPNFKGRWPRCSYFGVFDGHGGNKCSDFLKENMHRYITENSYFPHQPIEALKFGFRKAEQEFLKYAEAQNPIQRSGSCAIVLLIIDQICYIANVGDSRAILSANTGKNVYAISKDHKPDSDTQKERIFQAGGKIYQSSIKGKNGNTILGPFRIEPGKLSVSRSFGDIEAKHASFGGNSKVLIAKPEITYFQINSEEHDFVMLCSDGVYDKLANEEVSSCFWNERERGEEGKEFKQKYQFIGAVPSKVIERSMEKMSMDNLTCLVVVFQDNGKLLLPPKKNSRVIQKQIIRRPQSSLESENENKKNLTNTGKITIQREQGKSSRSSRVEQLEREHDKEGGNREKGNIEERVRESHREGKENTLKETRENIERIVKRKSSANLIAHQKKLEDPHHGSNSLTNSISAKMLSKATLKPKKQFLTQKLNLNELMMKKKGSEPFRKENKENKQSLWKQMANPKVDLHDKLIRF